MKTTKTLTGVERDGLDLRLITICFEIPDPEFDLLSAISDAVKDYAKTENGKKTISSNCGYFNLADVAANLPRECCEAHGFKMIDSALTDETIDWDYDFYCTTDEDPNETEI